jgi:hypothetical protein
MRKIIISLERVGKIKRERKKERKRKEVRE